MICKCVSLKLFIHKRFYIADAVNAFILILCVVIKCTCARTTLHINIREY